MPIDNSTRFPKPLAADLRELSEGMAIVIDGDTAPKAIASGQYLFIKNHSTLATGGYHATAAIASGSDITSSNVTPDADGIVNGAFSSLSEQIGNKVNTSAIANNLTTTSSGYVLDARAGKSLNDATNTTLNKNCSANGWSQTEYNCYKYGHLGLLTINGLKRSAAISGWSTALTLPSDVTCAHVTYGYLSDDTNLSAGTTKVYQCRVNTDGTIEVYSPQANVSLWGGIVFPCN